MVPRAGFVLVPKPARGATMHTLQQSEVVAAAAVADSDAPEVGAAGRDAYLFSSSSSQLLLLLSTRGCRLYERRENGRLHAEAAGDCKRHCRIVTSRI